MQPGKKLFLLCALILVLMPGYLAQADFAFAKAKTKAKNTAKKTKTDSQEDKLKGYFNKWFARFFSKLYYAKDVSEVKPFYSSQFLRGYDKIPDDARREVLDKLKLAYFAKPKIQSIKMHPSGMSCDISIKGFRSVYRNTGYGIGIYRMVKEHNMWKIDSSAQKGQAYTR